MVSLPASPNQYVDSRGEMRPGGLQLIWRRCLPALQGLGTWLFPLGTVSSNLKRGLQPGAQDLRVLLGLVFNSGVPEIDSPTPSWLPSQGDGPARFWETGRAPLSLRERNRSPCLLT